MTKHNEDTWEENNNIFYFSSLFLAAVLKAPSVCSDNYNKVYAPDQS